MRFIAHLRQRIVAAVAAALFVMSLLSAGIVTAAPPAAVSNVVYTQTNSPTGNEVVAYRRNADGTLTLLGRYSTRGTGYTPDEFGSPGPDDHDDSVVIDDRRQLLFVTNGGSNTIAVFKIAADGSLRHVPKSPFPSNGEMPVSVAVGKNAVYVVNKADPAIVGPDAAPNYSVFRIGASGVLTRLPNSTVGTDAFSSPTQVLVAEGGTRVFGADFFTGLIQSFTVRPNGRLTQLTPTPVTPPNLFDPSDFDPFDPNWPLGLATHPTDNILYVGMPVTDLVVGPSGPNPFVPGTGEVGVYTYDAAGVLTYEGSTEGQGGSPDSSLPCWIIINADATRMYVSNTGTNSVSTFDISGAKRLAPVEIDHDIVLPFAAARELEFSPDGQYIYMLSNNEFTRNDPSTNRISRFAIDSDGTLSFVDDLLVSGPEDLHAIGLAVR